MHQFLLQHPQIELDLVLSNQRIDLVQEGYDLAIRLGNQEGIWALYAQSRRLTSKVRTLIDYLSTALNREQS